MIYLPHKGLYIGDRIATWMFYVRVAIMLYVNSAIRSSLFFQMSDVPAGGRTVFPRIGAGVPPVGGSAVFWYNLKKSGNPDTLTLHGACPILYGTKWGKTNFPCFLETSGLLARKLFFL